MVSLASVIAIDQLAATLSTPSLPLDWKTCIAPLYVDLDSQVASPLAHALHLVGANFNELLSNRQCCPTKG